jgi:acyl-CoA synthetase (AMP-forming)/AMP-acid ligase II
MNGLTGIMNDLFSPAFLDSFVERAVDAQPDALSEAVPDCASLGKAWQRCGIRPGDLVLLCLPNGKELLHQFFGVLMAQGIPALISPTMPTMRLREIAQAMGARAIAALRLPAGDLGALSFEKIGRLQIAMLAATPEPAGFPGEVVLLTSGTSGFASGCVFDFESLALNGERHANSLGQRTDDTVLISLPQYFSFALSALTLGSLVNGNRLVISGPPFNPVVYGKTIDDLGVTMSALTPVLIRPMLKADPSSLTKTRVLSVGGDMLEADLVGRLVELREGRDLYLTYGLTQAGPRVSTLAAHTAAPSRYSSVGLPLDGTTVFLRPMDNGSGQSQLFVTSDTVMKRTIGRVEGRLHNDLVAPKTIATGDAFRQDEDGYLFYMGRLSDFISRKGEKVSLAAVRRHAAQLANVVSVKTRTITLEDGSQDFDLELSIDANSFAGHDASETHKALGRFLRRTEMPRTIHIHPEDESTTERYK